MIARQGSAWKRPDSWEREVVITFYQILQLIVCKNRKIMFHFFTKYSGTECLSVYFKDKMELEKDVHKRFFNFAFPAI